MIPLLIVIDVIASLTLILFILLHAGRGGGLSDMFGGGMNTSLGADEFAMVVKGSARRR